MVNKTKALLFKSSHRKQVVQRQTCGSVPSLSDSKACTLSFNRITSHGGGGDASLEEKAIHTGKYHFQSKGRFLSGSGKIQHLSLVPKTKDFDGSIYIRY